MGSQSPKEGWETTGIRERLEGNSEVKEFRLSEMALKVFSLPVSLPFYFYSLMLSGSSVSGGSEEELEATVRKWNLSNNSQGELLKTEVQMFQKQVLLYR